HDAQKSGFKKKCGEYLITQQGTGDITDGFHVAWPIGAELKRHGDTANHTQSKGEGKHFYPKAIGAHPHGSTTKIKTQFEVEQNPAQGDGYGWKKNVKTDVGGELNSRKY